MNNQIIVSKGSKSIYGQEYNVNFLSNGVTIYSLVCFGGDLRSVNKAYTKDFNNIKLTRNY